MTIIEALESIEAAAQGNARLAALKKAATPENELTLLLWRALSPDVTFGIKALPEPADCSDRFSDDAMWWRQFRELLNQMQYRHLTGNEAQDRVAGFLGRCDTQQLKWAQRVLRQDLRLNLGAKDVNKALGKNTIYLFDVPLATDYAKVKPQDLQGRWALQPKLDGGRCVAVLPANRGVVRLLSRTGKEWGNFESIRLQLQRVNDTRTDTEDLYVDGEVVSYVDGRIDFQSIQQTMHRKDGSEVGKLTFVVFDAAPAGEWQTPLQPYLTRLERAANFVSLCASSVVVTVDSSEVTSPTIDDLKVACKAYVERGFEGAMLRRADKPVQNKRSKDLLKVKLFQDDEAEVTGAVEGTGKYVGMLGALGCKTKEGVPFELGSGFDDRQRMEIWQLYLKGQLPGFANFKFFELTNDRVPRLPVFRGFRHQDDIGHSESDE